ncbi:oligosaccharide flippase family protein [Desulfoferrobacter suflitae]|uniref:oligosaccharide flippase family protein n=1 Tax=Desulfoferrobacter suflitae TaxID=2865782 RepID=UPI002164256C|nr:oligosaccharide flippase family protein [Desulfoferrobacter suflitae]MCK8603941.1 oligosaccharide flippase family protein [Desulfoferrobacter suflitae]
MQSQTCHRLAKGIFWSLGGAVISRGLVLLATVLVARILGKTVYGELGMIQSTVGMLGVFISFGLGLTATKHVAEFRQSDPARAGRIIGLSGLVAVSAGGLMAAVLLMSARWLAENTLNAPHLAGALRIGAPLLLLSSLNGAQNGALAGFEAFKTIAYVNFCVGLISFPILVCGAWVGGLTGAVWALLINLAVSWLLNHVALHKEASRHGVHLTFDNCRREFAVLWQFSLPAVLSGTLTGPVNWACGAMLVNQPEGYGEMGVFSAANQWRMAILFVPGMLGQVILPILANLNAVSTTGHYRKVIWFNIVLNGSIALLIVLPLILTAHYIMHFYGTGYEIGANVLRILALTAMLMAVNNVIGQAIASKGKMWLGFIFNALWAVVLLSFAGFFIKKGFGALGLSLATFIAYTLHTLWQGSYLRKTLRDASNLSVF